MISFVDVYKTQNSVLDVAGFCAYSFFLETLDGATDRSLDRVIVGYLLRLDRDLIQSCACFSVFARRDHGDAKAKEPCIHRVGAWTKEEKRG